MIGARRSRCPRCCCTRNDLWIQSHHIRAIDMQLHADYTPPSGCVLHNVSIHCAQLTKTVPEYGHELGKGLGPGPDCTMITPQDTAILP